jgi:hypothetical protein
MALAVAAQIVGRDVEDAALVDIAGHKLACGDEGSQPGCGIGIDLVVVGGHLTAPR